MPPAVSARDALLTERNAAEAIEQLADGTLSAALLRAPVQHPEGVRFDLLLEEEMVIALPLDHALLRRRAAEGVAAGTPVSLRELKGDPLHPGPPARRAGMYGDLLRECEALGFTPRIGAEVERMLTNLNLVAAGASAERGAGVDGRPQPPRRGLLPHGRDRPPAAPLTLGYRANDADPAVAALVALTHRIAARHRKEWGWSE